MSLRSLLLATALIFPGAAFAADLPTSKGVPMSPPAPAFTWTGFYVGLQAGYAWGNTKIDYTDAYTVVAPAISDIDQFSVSASPSGFAGGAYSGYNYQMGSFVVGIEGDVSFAPVTKKFAGDNLETKLGMTGTVRPRLGYAIGNALLFVTGGVAFGDPKVAAVAAPDELKGNTVGWVVGAGLDYAFTPNLIGRLEYQYLDFGSKTRTTAYSNAVVSGVETLKASFNYSVARAGLSYKF